MRLCLFGLHGADNPRDHELRRGLVEAARVNADDALVVQNCFIGAAGRELAVLAQEVARS